MLYPSLLTIIPPKPQLSSPKPVAHRTKFILSEQPIPEIGSSFAGIVGPLNLLKVPGLAIHPQMMTTVPNCGNELAPQSFPISWSGNPPLKSDISSPTCTPHCPNRKSAPLFYFRSWQFAGCRFPVAESGGSFLSQFPQISNQSAFHSQTNPTTPPQ